MTAHPRRGWMAAPVAIALAAGSLAALAAPASAAQTTFDQTTPIFLDDGNYNQTNATGITIPSVGEATPYPSQITVTHQATISDVDVVLNDVTHVAYRDMDVLLVGPGGQQVVLMSDQGNNGGTDIDLTLDDEAPTSLPDGTANVVAGTFKPSNNGAGDSWPAPAPASTDNLLLSTFDGTIAAGVWSLYVTDDLAGFAGDIASWTLNFQLTTTPYPSTISVGGLPPISDVNVKLQSVNSEDAEDINLLLVGPDGQQSYLIGDSGGGGNDLSNVNLTIDDEAAAPFPDTDPIVSGSYRPLNNGNIETFPAPAPPAGASSVLSVFDGLSPNGQWRLFALDDVNGDVTSIGGWSLEFTWADTLAPAGTVNVNGGAALATSKNVTLNLTATDPPPATGVTQMRFSNDGVTFSAYQPFAATAAWTLSGADGTKTVHAQFRDGDGNQSAVVSDAIKLDVQGPRAKKLNPKKNAKGVKTTVKVKIKANEALKKSTVTKKNVFLKQKGVSGKVKAKVKYKAATKTIVLTPVDDLKGGTTYKVTVKRVQDVVGHKWDQKPSKAGAQPLKYSFKTA
jgi:subtilisin-like proprotein convertase family protein